MTVERTRFDDVREFRGFLENWDTETFFYGHSPTLAPLARWAQKNFGEETVVGMETFAIDGGEGDNEILRDLTEWQKEYAQFEVSTGVFNKWVAVELLDHVLNGEKVA